MKFEDAEKKLVALADGEYCYVRYDRTHYGEISGGGVKQECTLYISRKTCTTKSTWERAFQSLEALLAGKPDPTLELADEGPEGEVDGAEKTV